jgi:hypothetical protein
MNPISRLLAGHAVFGLLVVGCSHADAAGDTIARELHEASKALTNWSDMKTDDF